MQTLPTDAADLTPSWMSEALGTEVTEVEVLDHAFATNQRARVALTYASDGRRSGHAVREARAARSRRTGR